MLPRALIGIPTFQRPDLLRDLLASLVQQEGIESARVLVMDNDPRRSALPVVRDFNGQLDLVYEVEPRPGVSHVRNRILEYAATFEALIFLDDDQLTNAGWLPALLKMHDQHPEAVIAGPVRYILPSGVDPRIVEGGFFVRPDHDEGAVIPLTGTGNSLLPSDILGSSRPPRFDQAFGSTGGEDTEFFGRLTGSGYHILWCSSAVACERVPPERATYRAAVSRYIRAGHVNGMIAIRRRGRIGVLVTALARLAVGSAKIAGRMLTARRLRGRDVATFYGGVGRLQSALGHSVDTYTARSEKQR